MKLLFLGDSWMGSFARSLKEALQRIGNGVDQVDELNEDLYIPNASTRWLRAIHRILTPAYQRELSQALIMKCRNTRPDVLLVYKGYGVNAKSIHAVKAMGIFTVNVFPDYSPHAYGERFRQVVGEYDLVVSTKPFHPALWQSLYGYTNRCVFVPHGYDPGLHLVELPADGERFDIVLAANWRPEYDALVREMARLLPEEAISVGIAGPGWAERREEFPKHWVFPGSLVGRSYVSFLRSGRIAIAPVNRQVVIKGQVQPGDEDTTRTYELPAAHCFFIHRRTDFVRTLFDERIEVPMFDSVDELVKKIRSYLPREEIRRLMAEAAHRRAVPAYSLDERAREVVREINASVALRNQKWAQRS
jgi:glycosyltransferase involved in cell wall biosynthesis